MKKKALFFLMATAILMALPSCEPDEDPLEHLTDGVKVTTTDPSYITGCSASCGAEVTTDNNGLLIELGVCFGLTENPTIDDRVLKSHKCSQPFQGLLTNLEPNTEYHVRGYAKYGTEYVYGDEKTFSTLNSLEPGASPVTTMPAYDIVIHNGYSCSFSSEVLITPFGATNWHAGVCFSQNPDFTLTDCEGYAMGDFADDDMYHVYCQCQWLSPNTTYYYRAFVSYAENEYTVNYNYLYGEILSLTTPDIPLYIEIVTHYPYYYWSENYIVASGYVECNKPEKINEVGFCYSITNSYPQYESDFYTVAGTPTGSWYDFQSYIYNPSANSKYYIRSYARYLNDSIKYGDIQEVYTY